MPPFIKKTKKLFANMELKGKNVWICIVLMGGWKKSCDKNEKKP
jgi:hypothetical protein